MACFITYRQRHLYILNAFHCINGRTYGGRDNLFTDLEFAAIELATKGENALINLVQIIGMVYLVQSSNPVLTKMYGVLKS